MNTKRVVVNYKNIELIFPTVYRFVQHRLVTLFEFYKLPWGENTYSRKASRKET